MNSELELLVHRESDNKVIGKVENKTFTKSVKFSKHFFRKYPGWAVDKDICQELKNVGVEVIKIIDTEQKLIYTVSLEVFLNNSIEIDFGHGIQLLLPLRFWNRKEF